MSDLLAIGSSGISAYQRALATVSNNIANVNTDGYTRQDVAITSNQPIQKGSGYIGSGARFDAVRRQFDAFIESNLRNSNSDLQAQEPLLSYVNRLIDIMGDQSIGLTTAMNQFFESARSVAADPASTIARSIFLRDADGLAARYRELASQLGLLQSETQQAVETDIGQINSYTMQLAQINKQLTKHSEEAKQPSELLDQRDLLLRELSSLVSIRTTFAPNGAVLVSVGDTIDQGILVNGVNARLLSVQQSEVDPNKLEFILDAYGDPESVPAFSSGKISGTVQFRDQVLNPALDALDDLAKVTVEQINSIHGEGLDAEGKLGGALFGFSAGKENTAAGVQMLIQDASRVAAAGQFRVIDNPLNGSFAESTVSYQEPSYAGPSALLGDLAWAKVPSYADQMQVDIQQDLGFASLGVAAIGMTDLSLTLHEPTASQSFQVLTRDGRHLAGTELTDATKSQMLRTARGMEEGATYSNSMLNETGDDAYLDMDIFIGVKATPTAVLRFNKADGSLLDLGNAQLNGDSVDSWTGNVADDTFTINGVSLPALNGPSGIDDYVTWINSISASSGVTAAAIDGNRLQLTSTDGVSDIRLGLGDNGEREDLDQLGFDPSVLEPAYLPAQVTGAAITSVPAAFAEETFTLNGVLLGALAGATSVANLATWINTATATTGVTASVVDGNRLSLTNETYGGEIRLGLSSSGTGADLAKLGFDTSLYIGGSTVDDLLIYVTDTSNTNTRVSVSGQYTEIDGNMKQALRESQLQVTFLTDTNYEIRDLETNTVVAQRELDLSTPTPSLSYRGLQLQFSNSPMAGDIFVIDGNQDGIGNNEVMLQLVALEDAEIMPGGLTLTEAYIERTNMVGNVARQAAISQQALEVVYQQALETRDGISGVNLDQEASALVRFQQAYQANAKVMQIAGTLFDAILQVR
jgi:flagellar hook-associated protein 1 FlgK